MLATLRDGTIFADAGFDLRLAINVPAMVLLKLPIATLIAEHRPSSDEWPGMILEVAEDQIVREIARTHKIFGELETCNVALAIDDFGAAYSSFSSLRDLPFAEIRLHGSFVKNCAADVTNVRSVRLPSISPTALAVWPSRKTSKVLLICKP